MASSGSVGGSSIIFPTIISASGTAADEVRAAAITKGSGCCSFSTGMNILFGLRLNVRVFVSDGEFLRQGFDLPSQLFGEGVFLLFPLEHVGQYDLRARVFGEVEGDVDCIPLARLESDGEDDGGVAPGPFYALPPFSHPWSLLGTSDR